MAYQPARGTRDFLPKDMIKQQAITDVARMIFESFGFEPLDTPAFESIELLTAKGTGGNAIKDEIYAFKDKGNRELGLRFDLTVPLARVVANNSQLPKPFKRYHIGKVWRYDRPQAGRFREFLQVDADIVGTFRMNADAECILVATECLKALGFTDFIIKLNNRKILDGFLWMLKLEKYRAKVLRALDKLEKIGKSAVIKEMDIPKQTAAKLLNLLSVSGSAEKIIEKQRKSMKSSATALTGLDELSDIVEFCKGSGVSNIEIDFSLVRGLDYYTGPIFEIVTKEKNLGSIAGGGRYDKLIEKYGGKSTPAVGISLGISRISEIMEKQSLFKTPQTLVKVFIVNAGESKGVTTQCAIIAKRLRKQGIPCQTNIMGKSLSKQMAYINSMKIPYALVIGEKEVKAGEVLIKNMSSGKQQTIPATKALDFFLK